MGDNRNNSKDSRSMMVGPLERRMIKGTCALRGLPAEQGEILGE